VRVTKRALLAGSSTFEPACVVPLEKPDRKRLMKTVIARLSITPEVAEFLLPEGLLSVEFESYSHVLGVSSRFDTTDQTSEPAIYLHP